MRSTILTAILVASVGCSSEAPPPRPQASFPRPQASFPRPQAPADQQQEPISGLICSRTNVNRTVIYHHDRNLDVTDWTIRFTNESPDPFWIAVAAEKPFSQYLLERNPQGITYKVLTLEGDSWCDALMGFYTFMGERDKSLEIPPNESLEFIVPIFDRFGTNPTQVRLEFRVTSTPDTNTWQTFHSDVYTHTAAPTDERESE